MKKFTTFIGAVAAALLFTTTASNATVSAPTFTFNENGVGQLELPNGAVIPLVGTLAADPGPGGLSTALVFTTHPQEGAAFIVGDAFLTGHGGTISDVLRFNPATSSGTGLTQLIFLYSNDAGGLLADVGLPAAFYPNSAAITENENATGKEPAQRTSFEKAVVKLAQSRRLYESLEITLQPVGSQMTRCSRPIM